MLQATRYKLRATIYKLHAASLQAYERQATSLQAYLPVADCQAAELQAASSQAYQRQASFNLQPVTCNFSRLDGGVAAPRGSQRWVGGGGVAVGVRLPLRVDVEQEAGRLHGGGRQAQIDAFHESLA